MVAENNLSPDDLTPPAVSPVEAASSAAPQDAQSNPALHAALDELPVIETLNPTEAPESPELEVAEEAEEAESEVFDTELGRTLSSPAGLRGAIEALLFVSPEPLTPHRIARTIGIGDTHLVITLLGQLQNDYDDRKQGIQIIEAAEGYQMASREVFGDLILRLKNRKRRPTLSQAALETLAIIAYRQPIIRAEVEAVRGVESSGTIRNLIDMGLVEMVGRKEVLGRPPMYGTNEQFLQSFGLRHLGDLPAIGELKRRFQENEDKQAQTAPPASPATAADDAAPNDLPGQLLIDVPEDLPAAAPPEAEPEPADEPPLEIPDESPEELPEAPEEPDDEQDLGPTDLEDEAWLDEEDFTGAKLVAMADPASESTAPQEPTHAAAIIEELAIMDTDKNWNEDDEELDEEIDELEDEDEELDEDDEDDEDEDEDEDDDDEDEDEDDEDLEDEEDEDEDLDEDEDEDEDEEDDDDEEEEDEEEDGGDAKPQVRS